MRDYFDYVRIMDAAMRDASDTENMLKTPFPHPVPARNAPRILIFSPHPDDEMIVGALPLRFLTQCEMRVIDCSVTLGSLRERKAPRLEELRNACAYIGFECITLGESGLDDINPEARENSPTWGKSVASAAETIDRTKPSAIFFPHANDANRTHMGVHLLIMDALAEAEHPCHCFRTEFWSPMSKPNLMVQSSPEEVAALVTALSLHTGEVARNPYHVRLPAWMADNVRRGSELIGGQGGKAPDFAFATLYRHSYWNGSRMEQIPGKGCFLKNGDSPALLMDKN